MQVLIDFPSSFESNGPVGIPLGRISLGRHGDQHVVRLFFMPSGETILVLSEAAMRHVRVFKGNGEVYGFEKKA